MGQVHKLVSLLSCMMLASSCTVGKYDLLQLEKPDLIDPTLGLNRHDYNNFSNPNGIDRDENGVLKATTNVKEPPIPDLAEILAAPKPPKLGATQLVSIAVTDDVPLKDVLIELARLADVDIEVDASITGGVAFRAKDRPFNEVIERLANLAGLRYSMKNNVLRVERDTPYVQIYTLDFLNLDRSAQSSVNISTSVLSSGGGSSGGSSGSSSSDSSSGSSSSGGGGGGLDNGSSSSVTSKAESDFWKQLEESIKQILTYQESRRISNTQIAEQPNAPNSAASSAAAAAGGGPAGTPTPTQTTPATTSTTSTAASSAAGFYIMNRQASTLTASATARQHELIQEFLKKIQTNSSSQVLIEAKIVEVTLNDQFQSGIDWSQLGSNKINFASAFGAVTDAKNVATFNIGSPHELAFTKNIDLSAAVQLAERFGTTRTLSSPRLHAVNNQEAVLTFAENQIYFSLTVTQTQSTTTTGSTGLNTLTVNSTAHTVPIGIILSLQPSINLDTSEVTLNIRPTLSRVTGNVTDPAVAFTLAQASAQGIDVTGISSTLPVIEVRELDSILKLKSGQVMVIGGLMQDISNNMDQGIPGLSSVPVVGNLFKGIDKQSRVQELVIFIRATIVDSNGSYAPADKSLYEKFTRDPIPIKF